MLAGALGAAGTPVLTEWTGQFIFSMPLLLYALFVGLLALVGRARDAGGRRAAVVARAALIGFAGACAGYAWLCQHWFFLSGLCFLVGFAPTAPLAYAFAKRLGRERVGGAEAALAALSFAVYFWSSTLFNLWKAGG